MNFRLRDNCLDFFRLFAAVNVMLVHFTRMMGVNLPEGAKWFHDSSIGVSMLYLICGYLIYASYERINKGGNNKCKLFYFNRLIRIYPPIWGSMLLLVFINLILHNPIYDKQYVLIILTEIIVPRGSDIAGFVTDGSLWTIPFELQFYLFFPVIYRVLERASRWKFRGIIFALIILNICTYGIDNFFLSLPLPHIFYVFYNFIFLPYLYVFIIGCYFYKYRETIFIKITITRNIILIAFLLIFWKICYTYWFVENGVAFGKFYNPITTILISMLLFGLAYKAVYHFRVDISYGIYIYHMIVINTLLKLGIYGNEAFVPVMLFTIILAVLSGILIEEPMRGIKRKLEERLFKE